MIQITIQPRHASLPGDMSVLRVLPYRGGKMVGPFAFLDHMGPFEISESGGGDVPPHPHIGLATVTYLTEGAILHRDSLGTIQEILPGDVNWMSAGKGIVHSERITVERRRQGGSLNGVQAWVAFPLENEGDEPSFQHVAKKDLPSFEQNGCRIQMIAGKAFGRETPVRTRSKLFYFEASLPAGKTLEFDPEGQEAALYLSNGKVTIHSQTHTAPLLLVFEPGAKITVTANSDASGFFLGGAPLDGKRWIWWNFVASSREKIEEAKRRWENQLFPKVPGETEFIPLPNPKPLASSLPQKMKALYFEKSGSLDALELREIDLPHYDPEHEALVRVRAAAINPSDPKNVLGKMSETRPPRVPGRDFAGVVVDGPAAWVGKEVFGSGGNLGFGRDGSHAEYLAVPVEALVRKPEKISFEQAAAFGVGYLTAWSAIVTAGQVSATDTVAVLGATGSVGSLAIKIARHRGARKIIGILRSEADRARVSDLPADSWVALDQSDLTSGILLATEGRGADLILNVVGGPTVEKATRALAQRGRQVVIASSEPQVSFNLVDFYHREAHLIGVDTLKLSFAESGRLLAELAPLVNAGVLSPPELEAVAPEQALSAYRSVLDGSARKKLVIQF